MTKKQYNRYLAPNDVYIHPNDICVASTSQTDKPARLARRANSLGLVFTVRKRVQGSDYILDDFTSGLLSLMQDKNLSFNQRLSLTHSPFLSPPIASNEPCWRLLYHKQVDRSATLFPKCYILEQPMTSLTYADVQRISIKFPSVEFDGILHNLLIIDVLFI